MTCYVRGPFWWGELFALLHEIHATCLQRGTEAALLDVTSAIVTPTRLKQVEPVALARFPAPGLQRLALLLRADQETSGRYWARIAERMGVRCLFFHQRDQAHAWLQQQAHTPSPWNGSARIRFEAVIADSCC